MTVQTRTQLQTTADLIENAVVVGENSASRVGGYCRDLLDSLSLSTELEPRARAVAVANVVSLSGTGVTIDSVALSTVGDVAHLTAQSSGDENGLWVIQSGPWTRPVNYAAGNHAAGVVIVVTEGTVYADSRWMCTTNAPSDVIDTDATAWILPKHSLLSGLTTGDDHTQYHLSDGSRVLTGNLTFWNSIGGGIGILGSEGAAGTTARVTIRTGTSSAGTAGDLAITGGNGAGTGDGATVTMSAGIATGSGNDGTLVFNVSASDVAEVGDGFLGLGTNYASAELLRLPEDEYIASDHGGAGANSMKLIGYDNTFSRLRVGDVEGASNLHLISQGGVVKVLGVTSDPTAATYLKLSVNQCQVIRGAGTFDLGFDTAHASGAGQLCRLLGQDAFASSAAAGGSILTQTGAGDGAGADGVYTVKVGSTDRFIANESGTTVAGGRIVGTTEIDHTDATYTILATDYDIRGDTDGGALPMNLPAGVNGTALRITNSGGSGNAITLTPDGAELLLGANDPITILDRATEDLTYSTTQGWY